MTDQELQLKLSRGIDHYLAALSKLYQKEGKREYLEILANSQVRVAEGWIDDSFNNGAYGHALFLAVPEVLYLRIVRKRDIYQGQIKRDLNSIHNVQGEYIAEVFLEMEAETDHDWRQKTGLVLSGRPEIGPDAAQRIWGTDDYRVFLSHKADVKKETAELKGRLREFGVSCFVAHEDIHPTKPWQDEIENALTSMDAFVALMTPGFHDSSWTDQEVGFALGRGVPIIAVKLGVDPYGFIGKFQALSCPWDYAPFELIKLLIKQPRMLDVYLRAVQMCSSWDQGNRFGLILPHIDKLTDNQVQQLISAFRDNSELQGSFGFNGKNPRYYGEGLLHHLSRITGKNYKFNSENEIQVYR